MPFIQMHAECNIVFLGGNDSLILLIKSISVWLFFFRNIRERWSLTLPFKI